MEKGPHNIPFSPTGQTARNVGFVVKCEECNKSRLLHAKHKLKPGEIASAKRMMSKVSYMCGSVLSEYLGIRQLFVRENISCSSNIELPYYTVDVYPKICIYCGISGTSRTLGNYKENYPKCMDCNEKPDIVCRKRKSVIEKDLAKKKK